MAAYLSMGAFGSSGACGKFAQGMAGSLINICGGWDDWADSGNAWPQGLANAFALGLATHTHRRIIVTARTDIMPEAVTRCSGKRPSVQSHRRPSLFKWYWLEERTPTREEQRRFWMNPLFLRNIFLEAVDTQKGPLGASVVSCQRNRRCLCH